MKLQNLLLTIVVIMSFLTVGTFLYKKCYKPTEPAFPFQNEWVDESVKPEVKVEPKKEEPKKEEKKVEPKKEQPKKKGLKSDGNCPNGNCPNGNCPNQQPRS